MKSKSFDLKKSPADAGKHNKTYDFVGYYNTIETSKINANAVSGENANKENSSHKTDASRHERSLKKRRNKNEPVDVTHVNIDENNLSHEAGRNSPAEAAQHTSTPYSTSKGQGKAPKVKSIMKNSTIDEEANDGSIDISTFKPKKRNKSVSFMLEENEEVVVKKSKSEDSLDLDKINAAKKKAKIMKSDLKKLKKIKKQLQAEKENKADTDTVADKSEDQNYDTTSKKTNKRTDKLKNQPTAESAADSDSQVEKKKKSKKFKKPKETDESSPPTETENNNNEEIEHKVKKLKKKKHQSKTPGTHTSETTETDGEPVKKSRKKEIKPEIVAEDLEHLSIGDNAHTLTNLLDEMTVVDKDRKKKNKIRRRKEKKSPVTSTASDATDLEKIEEGKEKIKWKKRKWNKDKKGDADSKMATTVIIDNLPISIMMEYKKLLAEHFGKCGLIQGVGVAEMFPTDDYKPVFTTTIQFYSEAAAEKALEEDNSRFSGSCIRVRRPLPATETTVVARSYGELTEQALSSVFSAAGRVRSIRLMVKGRKAMATAFIEFDGPAAVERAIKMAEDARIGGKKIHVSRYEQRHGRKQRPANSSADSENDASEDSN